ncbi:DUF3368 domain-containing protein [Thiocystis minor]|uniref:DUF3368 domain-containing protein n=1 Tax=Thiocystis minor TaxID=61597 RepID=UPI001914BE45|nr:DUF3368 domain-containing protein [Thiocystis minor]MBK5965878.1 DUF3368 domain-containing protein [Thiocystis minor]
MARLVLIDASPLIGLARVEGLSWLRALFGEVWMPSEVQSEVLPRKGLPDEQAILAALDAGWLRVRGPTPTSPALPDLDEGEAACIRLALASVEPVLVLMDERAGRAIASEHGLRVAGTAAVIGMAKSKGLIPSAREVFARLHASDFRISAKVIETLLRRVGE